MSAKRRPLYINKELYNIRGCLDPVINVMGCSDTNKNKLQNPSVIHETNLVSLINPSLAYIYCSTTLSNHRLIRLKKFVSQQFHNQFIFNTPCMFQTSDKTATKVQEEETITLGITWQGDRQLRRQYLRVHSSLQQTHLSPCGMHDQWPSRMIVLGIGNSHHRSLLAKSAVTYQ